MSDSVLNKKKGTINPLGIILIIVGFLILISSFMFLDSNLILIIIGATIGAVGSLYLRKRN